MPVPIAFDVATVTGTQAMPIGEFAFAPQRLVLRNVGHRRVWLGDQSVRAWHGDPLLPGDEAVHGGVGILYAIAEPNPGSAIIVFVNGTRVPVLTVAAQVAWRVEPEMLP